jgi:putative flippase GtrA
MSTDHTNTFLRFLIVGGTFSLSYSLLTAALINFANAPAFAVTVVVYLLCIPAAFYAQKHVAFRMEHTQGSAFVTYFATQVGSLVIVSAITTRFVTKVFWIDTAILLVTAGSAAVLSYVIGRFITFRTTD